MVKRTPHVNHVAILRCDESLIAVRFRLFVFFSEMNISQGSVATRLKCGGIFYYRFVENLLLSPSVEEF